MLTSSNRLMQGDGGRGGGGKDCGGGVVAVGLGGISGVGGDGSPSPTTKIEPVVLPNMKKISNIIIESVDYK